MSRLVVISNRVAAPTPGKAAANGGGLAVAMQEALASTGGLWFGWSGHSGENPQADPHITERDGVTYAQLDLSATDYDEYYNGYANSTLWPLFHYRLDLAAFRQRTYAGYHRVNALFAHKLAQLLRPDDVIWVHDYHLIPIAEELRQMGYNNRIGFFLHTPFPVPEVLGALPNLKLLMRSFCAYDLIGFQTESDNAALRRYLTDWAGGRALEDGRIEAFGRTVETRVFPISIDVAGLATLATDVAKTPTLKRFERSLNDRQLVLGVDRLDYSKGLPQRFEAFGKLLENYPDMNNRVTMMQIAPPSRENVPEYQAIRAELEQIAGHINGLNAEFDWQPLRYINKGYSRRTLAGFYRIARIGLVTPLRDGMNLVAKEFVAAQDPEDPGVLVLSQFAGAASELGGGALLVNPYDIEDSAENLRRGLSMPLDERKERWQTMWATLEANTIEHWRKAYLKALHATAG
jgi:trehalose 6-phosphate synthase